MSVFSAQDINVKCRAMYSRLLSRREYDILLSAKSVPLVTEYLKKETPYAYVLRRFNTDSVHRGQLEQVFRRSLFYDYERLVSFATGSYKIGLRTMFEAYEVDDLKLVISSICSEHEHLLTSDDLTYVRHYSSFTPEALLGAATIEQLAENLRGTRYHKLFLPFAEQNPPDFLKIDYALNLLNYRTKMTVFKNVLGGTGRWVAVSLYGTQADIENILFIYRIKKLYHFSAKDILLYLMPCNYRISRRELLALAECDDIGEMIRLIGRTHYGFLFPAGREDEWERIQAEYFYSLHKRNLRQHGSDIGVALSYLFLKENDIRNIIIIVEGIRYKLPVEIITPLLVGYHPVRRAGSAA